MFRAPGGIRTWLAAVAVAASTLLVAPSAAHASGSGTLAADINAARASAGVRTLTYDGSLAAVAQSWADHMASSDQLAHNPSTPSQIRAGWSAWGENVGFTTTGSASALNQAFMASADHRANILNGSFTSLGVGWATKNGHTYVAEVFAAYPQAATSSGSSKSSGSARSSSGSSSSQASGGGSGASSGSSSGAARAPAASSTPSRTGAQPPTAPPTVAPPVHPDGLVRGDTGPKVRAMQARLGAHGHAVRTDGLFGPVTDRAVRAFQDDAGLTVDGIVGKRTSAALARPAPKRPAPAKSAAPTTPAGAATTTPDATSLLAMARDTAAARSDGLRTPLAARLSPTPPHDVFVSPAAFTTVPATTTATAAGGSPGPSTAAVLGTLLTLAAAAGAAITWAVRRRRAGRRTPGDFAA